MKLRLSISTITTFLMLQAILPSCAQTEDRSQPANHREAKPEVTQTGPSGIMSIVAGTGYGGYGPLGGLAINAGIVAPQGVAIDPTGNLYISAPWLAVVYKVAASTGDIAIYAGTGEGGYGGDGGLATAAKLGFPYGLALDSAGDLYIADETENRIRKVTVATGKISTVAGDGAGAAIGANDLCSVAVDGIAATSSGLCLPSAVAVDASGNLYIADYGNNRIRKVTASTGIISTIAGPSNGYAGDGGLAVNAALNYPVGVAVDSGGNVYIADTSNCAVRKIEVSTGVITSLTGTPNGNGSRGTNCPNGPGGISLDGTLATAAQVGRTHAIAVDGGGNVFFSDSDANVVHLIDAAEHKLYTVAGINFDQSNSYEQWGESYLLAVTPNPGPGNYQWLDDASGVAVDTHAASPTYGDVIFGDASDDLVYKVTRAGLTPGAVPSITPAFTTAAMPTAITITPGVTGSTIYYTTDGSVPTTGSAKYTAPFTLSKSAIVTAFATVTGESNSQATIDIFLDAPEAGIHPATEGVAGATAVTISDASTGGTIYYTTDGSDPQFNAAAKRYTAGFSVTPTSTAPVTVSAAFYTAVTDFAGNVWPAWSSITSATYKLATKPAVTTTAASSIAASGATLNGTLNPDGGATQFWFLYGTASPPTTATAKTTYAGTGPIAFNLTGLRASTKYYFQAVASNVAGTTTAATIDNFTTIAATGVKR
jgi:sugar lactone lactonase YvrE